MDGMLDEQVTTAMDKCDVELENVHFKAAGSTEKVREGWLLSPPFSTSSESAIIVYVDVGRRGWISLLWTVSI